MNDMFFAAIVALVIGLIVGALVWINDDPRPLPTEAELVIMERMAKISATLQGVCK